LWKHTQDEQRDARNRYKQRVMSRVNASEQDAESKVDRYINQYIIDYEGEDSEEELFDHLKEQLDDEGRFKQETVPKEEEEPDEAYITTFGRLSPESANQTVIELANRAFIHQLTAKLPW
jgi:hypothetical protein